MPALLTGFLLCGASRPARAQQSAAATHCLLLPLDAARRSQQAALVVEGEVLSADGFWDARHQRIFTAHRVRVFSAFKGQPAAELTVLTEGGTVGEARQELTNTLRLSIGDQGVFFLYNAPWPAAAAVGPAWAAYGSQQGFIRYDLATLAAAEPFQVYPAIDNAFYAGLSAQTGQTRRVLAPNEALAAAQRRSAVGAAAKGQAPVIGLLAPLRLAAGAGEVLTITGSGFGAARGQGFVEFRNADDGGQTFIRPQPADYVSWTDGQIRVRVPSYGTAGNPAGTGDVRVTTTDQLQATSAQRIIIAYALANVQDSESKVVVPSRHSNQDGRGGLTFQMEAGFAANAGAAQILRRGLLQTWRCQTGINWTMGSNRTGRGAAKDGENSVGFDSGSELPAGVLGRTTSYYLGCVGPRREVYFYVKEVDIQFDDGVSFFYGPGTPGPGQFDFESVLVHELGHAQQLSHVILPAAVMHFGVAPRQVKQTLSPDDVAGARRVLRTRSFAAPVCGPAAMLPAPLTTLAVGRVNTGNEVAWTTRDECFVREFIVERAADTTAWQVLATLPAGAGTNAYRFVDAQPLPGLSYYRLRLRRPDGTLDAAAPLSVTDEADVTGRLVVFPNPIQDGLLRLQFVSPAAGALAVYLHDALGRFYRREVVELAAGLNIRSVATDDLRPGWYLLRWRDQSGKTGATRFIKLAP
ncbi:matrixin family metalloprotease [Hymenobacter daecheongensis]|uniref:matrixin family metalloprotease n=1 Tax=Hymenobacter daecheongensis TaxID=496053 RepID=UPI0013566AA1|nr:matrixin family metalloprotease [Hymenobacter daecheongensis]